MAESGIKNFDKLLRKLDRLDDVTKGSVMKEAVIEGAKVIQAQAKKNCKGKKFAYSTGELAESIRIKSKVIDGKQTAIVYTNKKYAPCVEFGTGPRGEANKPDLPPEIAGRIIYHQGGWYMPGDAVDKKQAEMYHLTPYKDKDGNVKYYYTEGQKPHPFMYPAAVEKKREAGETVARIISEEIKKLER